MDNEFALLQQGYPNTHEYCKVLDTLVMARNLHPGQKNNLDALCRRYDIDNAKRTLHGALLDSEILADVYLAMTGGQVKMNLANNTEDTSQTDNTSIRRLADNRPALKVVKASADEIVAHEERLKGVNKNGETLWQQN